MRPTGTDGPRCRRRPGCLAVDGFTLAETVVAMTLALSLLAVLVPICRQAAAAALAAHDQSMAAMLAVARMEQLRGLTFRFEHDGTGSLLRVTDTETDLTGPVPATGGPGLGAAPPGTLLRDTPGWVDHLDALGRWVSPDGAGGAAYVRRWAVTPLLIAGEDAVLIQVLVAPLGAERRAGPRVDASRRPGDVWLTLVRTRVS